MLYTHTYFQALFAGMNVDDAMVADEESSTVFRQLWWTACCCSVCSSSNFHGAMMTWTCTHHYYNHPIIAAPNTLYLWFWGRWIRVIGDGVCLHLEDSNMVQPSVHACQHVFLHEFSMLLHWTKKKYHPAIDTCMDRCSVVIFSFLLFLFWSLDFVLIYNQ